MTASPRVSVVLPVYNGCDFLAESISSVLAQSFSDFELLVWDDASCDGSWEIASDFRDERIVRHRHPRNGGLFANINHALGTVRAPLVRLWSQDDRMKPHCLETEQRFFARHPHVGFLYCQRDIVDRNGNILSRSPQDSTPEVMPGRVADEITFNWGSMPGNISTVTIRKEVLEELGPFDVSASLASDFEMWVRIQASYDVGFCRRPLIDLRDHERQLSRRYHAELEFLRHCRQVYQRLHERLDAETRAQRERYARIVHPTPYFHAALRAALRLDWGHAIELLLEIERWHGAVGAAFGWLSTINLRYRHPAPVYSEETRRFLQDAELREGVDNALPSEARPGC